MLLKMKSLIRGYDAYMDDWEPNAEDAFLLTREPNNMNESNAVALVQAAKEKTVMSDQVQKPLKMAAKQTMHPNNLTDQFDEIGHVPKLMATWLTKFLKRPSNSGKTIIKGKRVNSEGGYGLEVPCEYHFQGDDFSCNWLKQSNERRIRSAMMTRLLTLRQKQ